MSVVGGLEFGEVRRRHLTALAREVEARGLAWRFAGPGETVLGVLAPLTRRQVMVVAMPDGEGWSYLWPGGGIADVTVAGDVADQLARMLS